MGRDILAVYLIGKKRLGFQQVLQRMGGEVTVGAMENRRGRISHRFRPFQYRSQGHAPRAEDIFKSAHTIQRNPPVHHREISEVVQRQA